MCALTKIERRRWIRDCSGACPPAGGGGGFRQTWRLILLGPPGIGKGTQAQLLKHRLGACHLSTGDLFRAACSHGACNLSPALSEAMNYMKQGQLVPDSTVWEMVQERAECLRCRAGFLLDGFPRTIPQAQKLQDFLGGERLSLTAVVAYGMPLDEIVKRLGGRRVCENCNSVFHIVSRPSRIEGVCDECGGRLYQRPDDCPASISVRLEAYERNTAPLIQYYRELGLLTLIDAGGTADQVFARTMTALQARIGRSQYN